MNFSYDDIVTAGTERERQPYPHKTMRDAVKYRYMQGCECPFRSDGRGLWIQHSLLTCTLYRPRIAYLTNRIRKG
jgi:hypothetical protein